MKPVAIWESKGSKTHPGAAEYRFDVVQILLLILPGRCVPTSLWFVEDESRS